MSCLKSVRSRTSPLPCFFERHPNLPNRLRYHTSSSTYVESHHNIHLKPPQRPDPASKSPLQTVFLRCPATCMQGRVLQQLGMYGAREENVVSSVVTTVSGTCIDCCAAQASLPPLWPWARRMPSVS